MTSRLTQAIFHLGCVVGSAVDFLKRGQVIGECGIFVHLGCVVGGIKRVLAWHLTVILLRMIPLSPA